MISPTGTETDTSTHTSARMSARPRIEVITAGRAPAPMVVGAEAGDRGGESVAACLADRGRARHGIGTGQLYTWRRQLLGRELDEAARFARVEVAG